MNRFLPVVFLVFLVAPLQAEMLSRMTASRSTFIGPLIDDFNYPALADVIFSANGNPKSLLHNNPNIIGGERQIFIKADGQENDISWGLMVGWVPEIGRGELAVATATWPGTYVRAEYNDLGFIDLTRYTGFEIGFPGIDAGSGTTLLRYDIEVRGLQGIATYSGYAPESLTPTIASIPFSQFTIEGNYPFAAAKDMAFSFNAPYRGKAAVANVDFEVSYIKMVPEPSSMVLLLAALMAVGIRVCQIRNRT